MDCTPVEGIERAITREMRKMGPEADRRLEAERRRADTEAYRGARDRLQSLVLDVGDRVVDGVPNSIKTMAIDWFGTKDKLALLTGIGIVLALYAAALGVIALTRS